MTNGNDGVDLKAKKANQSGRYGRIIRTEDGGYRWMPYALTFDQVKEYYTNFSKEDIPYLNTDGDLNRMNSLLNQIPKQDIDSRFCNFVKYDAEIKYNQFMDMRNSKYFDVGIPRKNEKFSSLKCRGCQQRIDLNTYYIQSMITFNTSIEHIGRDEATEALKSACWHPKCFKCVRCPHDEANLVDLAHCVFRNKLYCVRHFDERFRPRCGKCHEEKKEVTYSEKKEEEQKEVF